MATLVGEERETLDRLQHLTERRDQLATSLSSAETALRSAQTRVEQLHQEMEAPEALLDDAAIEALEKEVVALQQTLMEATQRMEGLRLERVRLETRVTLLRKQAVEVVESCHIAGPGAGARAAGFPGRFHVGIHGRRVGDGGGA